MRHIKKILSFIWPVFFIVNFLRTVIFRTGSVRILNYHNIPPEEIKDFNRQIKILEKKYIFITPEEFDNYQLKNKKPKKNYLLLTFDDGFVSNRNVCEKVLDPMGIKAIFFILSSAANESLEEKQKIIYDGIFKGNKNLFQSGLTLMDRNDIAFLIKNGHSIGSHTDRHRCLAKIVDENNLKKEIVRSADELETFFKFNIKYFAYPFGSIGDINQRSIILALKRYVGVFSGIRGANYLNNEKSLFFRDEISPKYSYSYLRFILEGGLDLFYFFDRVKLKKMAYSK